MRCINCINQGYGENEEEPICTHPCGPIGVLNLEEDFENCVGYEEELSKKHSKRVKQMKFLKK